MHRPAETELQLRSAANAADRKNRPAALVIGPAILLVLTLLYAIWSWAGYTSASRAYDAARADMHGTYDVLQRLLLANDTSSELEDRYERNAYLLTDIGDQGDGGELGLAGKIGLELESMNDQGISPLQRNDPIGARRVNITIRGQELDKILEWINACLQDPRYKGRLFVYSISLRPNPTKGWDASPITLAIHEKTDN